MIRFAARADLAVLHFDEVADMHAAAQYGARPQACKRPDSAILATTAPLDDAIRIDFGVGADARIADARNWGPTLTRAPRCTCPINTALTSMNTSRSTVTSPAHVDARRIRQGRPCQHQFLGSPQAAAGLDLRKLDPVVDAQDLRRRRRRHRVHAIAGFHRAATTSVK